MTTAALAIYVLFAFLAFGWRTWRQYRRTGDHGIRGYSGRIGSKAWWGGCLWSLGAVAGLLAPLADLSGNASRLRIVLPEPVAVSGLALMLLGSVLALVAQIEMASSWRVGVDSSETTALVTTGLFRWVRNPIFTAMLAVLFGMALAVPNVIAGVALAASLAGIEIQVREVEEPYLIRVHGERYLAYARTVGRFVPGMGRMG